LGETSQLFFREMTADDIDALVAIEKKCFGKRDAWRRGAFIGAVWSLKSVFLVAELDGQVIGCAGAEINSDAAEIQTVSVDPAYHGRGIGTKLFAELLTAIQARGATMVYLEVRTGNTPAIDLYEKFGFQVTAQLENFYHNEDALVMFKNF